MTINDNLEITGRMTAKEISCELSDELKDKLDTRIVAAVQTSLQPITEAVQVLAMRIDELEQQLTQARSDNAALTEKINKNIIL